LRIFLLVACLCPCGDSRTQPGNAFIDGIGMTGTDSGCLQNKMILGAEGQ
jgi:hypothetical protein